MISIKEALLDGKDKTDNIDCEVLLCEVLKVKKAFLYTHPEQRLTEAQLTNYQKLINLRSQGIPVAYLTGHKEFWSLNLQVSPATLIPRADTEILVEQTLGKLKNKKNAKILELGTGSGAIAIAIAKMRPDVTITACDICEEALAIARNNAKLLAVDNINFILSDWFTNISTNGFDAIISNPPYIAADDPHLSQGDIKFEPSRALVSGNDGLESLKHIISYSKKFLATDGFIILEHGYDQRNDVEKLLKLHGFQNIICFKDLGGNDRVSYGRIIIDYNI